MGAFIHAARRCNPVYLFLLNGNEARNSHEAISMQAALIQKILP